MTDELDRYKQILNDWQTGGPSAKPRPTPPRPTPPPPAEEPVQEAAQPRAKLARPADAEAEDGRYPKGTILSLDEEDLVIYRRPVSGKPFDMVYSLLFDGKAKIEAIDLSRHQVVEMGRLSSDEFARLQTDMVWSRQMVASGCFRADDAERIPDPSGAQAAAAQRTPAPEPRRPSADRPDAGPIRPAASPADSAASKTRIRRGQKISIIFGDRRWESIYWGKDQKGSVVAHKTHGHWTLMHLDLNRFKESLSVSSEPEADLIDEINQDLAGTRA